MAADRQRLAAALAYEEERRRRMMESVPGLVTTPAQPAPRADFRTNLENLSIGLGEGLTNQLEGIKGIVTDPVGTAKGVYEAGRAVIRDPSVIADALRYTAQKATSGPLGAGEVIGEMIGPRKGGPMMQELDVYHGTPHRFPATEANPLGEFDASKIGTGEGAQAYGHGIYFAESPSVAKAYQNPNAGSMFLGSRGINVSGKTYSSSGQLRKARDEATDMTEKAMYDILATAQSKGIDGPSKIAKAIKDNPVAWGSWEFGQDTLNAAMKRIRKEASFSSQKGSFYKADLPDEMIDRMLDWDKPLSEQPFKIQQAIFNDLTDAGYSKAVVNDLLNRKTGMEFFRTLHTGLQQGESSAINLAKKLNLSEQEMFMDAPALASAVMRRMGIPGIKYLDAGSRGQGGSGTRNFVVFPGEEKKVRILERDGQKAPPQKIAQALEAAPDYRMTHRPMSDAGGASRLHNAYESFGEDIYGPKALQYFGAGDPREAKVVTALKRLRDNPDAEVTIYRGVPKDATGEIGKGDWVTLDRSVAAEYGDKVLTKKVKAKDITTWPDSLLEFGYYPEN